MQQQKIILPWELIDTLWNVNVDTGALRNSITHELIDTLWNVNTSAAEEPSGDAQELIDTLWNVNKRSGCPESCR